MTIAAHCLVKNEQNWIWYALNSVLSVVDEIDIVDTGSTDQTCELIRSMSSSKIKLTFSPTTNANTLSHLRQSQLDRSLADWILILDGDEVWTTSSLSSSLVSLTSSAQPKFLISSYINCVGDVYHRQPISASRYKIKDYTGPVSVRWFKRNITGLHYSLPYGAEGLFVNDTPLQESLLPYAYVAQPYFHLTHLVRTSAPDSSTFMRKGKFKHELGLTLPSNFEYPASFYFPRPAQVPTPWSHRSFNYLLNASWQTPLRYLKRTFHP